MLLQLLQQARVLDFRTIAQHHEGRQAHVDADGLAVR
jgi:hypothetical protein